MMLFRTSGNFIISQRTALVMTIGIPTSGIKTSIDLSIGNYASAIVGNSKILCRAKSFIGFTAFVWSNQSRSDLKLAKPVENTYELVSHKTFIILVSFLVFFFSLRPTNIFSLCYARVRM
jgi:hypothetical protein